jgi:hypothetical protein
MWAFIGGPHAGNKTFGSYESFSISDRSLSIPWIRNGTELWMYGGLGYGVQSHLNGREATYVAKMKVNSTILGCMTSVWIGGRGKMVINGF